MNLKNQASVLISPRIAQLKSSLESGDSEAIERFWAQVESEGTPLIEPIPENDHHALVTFLFRGDGKTEHVVLHSEILRGMWWNRWSDALLYRLLDTDVFYRSYRLPMDMRFVYWFSPNRPLVHVRDDSGGSDKFLQTDPLNPRVCIEDINRSFVEMPNAPPQPWWQYQPQVPTGDLNKRTWHSDRLDNDRHIWVYTPPGYSKEHELYPFLLLFDGDIFTTWIPGPTILDNLIAEGRIPPLVAVMLDSPNRSVELYGDDHLVDSLVKELIPWVRQSYNITDDPLLSIAAGVSAGGLAAVFLAMSYPEIFGNVSSHSAPFGWSKEVYNSEEWSFEIPPEDCWFPRQFATREKLPIRFHLDVGLLEDQRDFPYTTNLRGNRHLRDVLKAKGYWVHYLETCAGHQYINFRGTFPEGLIALIGS